MNTIHKKIVDYVKRKHIAEFTKEDLIANRIVNHYRVDDIITTMIEWNILELIKWKTFSKYSGSKTVAVYKIKEVE